jgi:hypothetical protein
LNNSKRTKLPLHVPSLISKEYSPFLFLLFFFPSISSFSLFSSSIVYPNCFKQLEKQLKEQKARVQNLAEEKEADTRVWNTRREEWESLCEKITIERDALRSDNERTASLSAKFEGMCKRRKKLAGRT